MNILQLKYAIEAEKTGSISKAAENLYVGQPRLSKSIKELEESVGIAIFKRTSAGVVPTAKGKEFLKRARDILSQLDEMEALYRQADGEEKIFKVSSSAFGAEIAFIETIGQMNSERNLDASFCYTETAEAIKKLANGTSNMAVIQFAESEKTYISGLIKERNLFAIKIGDFENYIIFSKQHPLANTPIIEKYDIAQYRCIINNENPPLNQSEISHKILFDGLVPCFATLSRLPSSYMLSPPICNEVLDKYNLTKKLCNFSSGRYQIAVICRSQYQETDTDKLFTENLNKIFAEF